MQIDGFTFVAQIVNFLVLVGLLKYFLYGPVLRAMDEREQTIASRLEEAKERRERADEEMERYRQMTEGIEKQRGQMIADAQHEAEERKGELMRSARAEVDNARQRWNAALEQERRRFLDELRQQAARQVFAISRRALAELADAELERRVVDKFVQRIEGIDDEQRDRIRSAIARDGAEVVIRTAFDCSAEQRERITAALQRGLGVDGAARFEVSEELLAGIELKAGGHKIAWSIDEYVDDLETALANHLGQELA